MDYKKYGRKSIEQYKHSFPSAYSFFEWLETETKKGSGIKWSWYKNAHFYAKVGYLGRIEFEEKEVVFTPKPHSQIHRGTKDCSHLLFPEPIISTVQRYPNFHEWAKIDNNIVTIKNNAPSSVFEDIKELIIGINEGRKVKPNDVQAEQTLEPEPIPVQSKPFIERQIRNAGAGFGTAEKNREVEKAAISFVTKQYKSQGWEVQSVEFEKKGYDLICKKEPAEEHVEVKGVRGTERSFIVTSGEVRQARENPRSVVCVVTSALSDKPLLSCYTGQEFIEKFELEELAFRASLRKKENRRKK